MPRRPAINDEGIYHVGTRGNFGAPLFTNDAEHELYLSLYERNACEFGWVTIAWVLLRNHHHFLIKLTRGGLSEGMRRVNHGFSRRINAIYNRTGAGHLVRHSFFAREVATDVDLRAVCRYVDLNPVAAKQCDTPERWPWSGCAATLGLVPPRAFHDVHAQLSYFADRPNVAQARYARLLSSTPSQGRVSKP